MQNHLVSTDQGIKGAAKRSSITCPHCGHSLALFRKAAHLATKRPHRLKHRRQLQPFFQVARGATLWFAIVFTIAAMLAGAVQQTVWPLLCGIGLLAAYGFTCWWIARWAK